MGAREVRVVVCDDRRLLREAVGRFLTARPDVCSVRLAADGTDAVRLVRAGADVLVLSVEHAGDVAGLEVLEALSNQTSRVAVLVLGSNDRVDTAVRALALGAAGYLREDVRPADLYDAIMGVAAGHPVIPDYLVAPMLLHVSAARKRRTEADEVLAKLTQRERTVLLLLGHGLTRQRIADRLGLSVNTVRTHIGSLLRKLDVHTQLAAAVKARMLGESLTIAPDPAATDSR